MPHYPATMLTLSAGHRKRSMRSGPRRHQKEEPRTSQHQRRASVLKDYLEALPRGSSCESVRWAHGACGRSLTKARVAESGQTRAISPESFLHSQVEDLEPKRARRRVGRWRLVFVAVVLRSSTSAEPDKKSHAWPQTCKRKSARAA